MPRYKSRSTIHGPLNFYFLKLLLSAVLALASVNSNIKHIKQDLVSEVKFYNNTTSFIFGNSLSPRCNLQHFSLLLTRPNADLAALVRPCSIRRSCLCKLSYKSKRSWLLLILLLAGDVEVNPGPHGRGSTRAKYPCGICRKACRWGQKAIACDGCGEWYHSSCAFVSSYNYEILANTSLTWCCFSCGLPNFSSGLFDNSTLPHSFNIFNTLNNSDSDSFTNGEASPSKFHPKSSSTPNSKNNNQKNCKGNPPPKIHKVSVADSVLNCLIINFQSLIGKKEEVSNLVNSKNIDIIIGTETWLKPDISNSELLLDDFDVYRCDRLGRVGGGCLVGIKKYLTSEFLFKSEASEGVFCKINIKGNKPIIIGSIYRPPNKDIETCNNICKDISFLINNNKNSVFWFGGDFNLPDINWQEEKILSNKNPKELNSKFLDLAADFGLKQTVVEPTRGSSCLDLFFNSNPDLVQKCSVVVGVGDHDAVFVRTKLQLPKKKPIKREIKLWKKINVEKLKKDCEDFKNSFLKKFNNKSNINELWDFIKNNLTQLMKNNVPTKTASTKRHQPWITTTTKRLLRKKQRWYTKAKKSNSKTVWDIFKKIKRECQKVCRKAHSDYLLDIINNDTNNKKLFRYIKNKGQENIGISDLKDNDNNLIQDPVHKANLLNNHFGSVFSKPLPHIKHSFPANNRLPDINGITVTRAGVLKLLLNINPNKATGPDGIPGRLLKLCAHELVEVFQLLFQTSLDQGLVPSDWRLADIVPLYKKGDKMQAGNYRPVSLTSITCKLLEHIIHSNIMDHFDRFNVLNNSQHGFRKKRSCETQLINTIKSFSECLNSRGQIDAILLDFSKAFDKVDHEGLIIKLENVGIRGKLLNWIRSFLIGREQRVLVDGRGSDWRPVLSGVPQGTVLGPLFFLVYINDITNNLSPGTSVRLFADDSLLFRTINNINDTKTLQKDLDLLQTWEKKWKMEFHPDKCQLLRITNKTKNYISSDYFIHDKKLELTDSAKYLGVEIDNKLNWKQQCTNVCKKSNKVLAFLRRNIHSCPVNIKNHCFKSLVRPALDFGSVVWDPHHQVDKENLEKVHKRAARFVSGNYVFEKGNTQINMKKLGWEPLEERRARTKVTTLFKAKMGLIDIPLEDLNLNNRINRKGNCLNYTMPVSNVDCHLHSFYPSTIRLWNLLPKHLQECGDTDTFKAKLDDFTLRASYKN